MKKLLAILISIFLAVSFTGCNQDDDESKQTETVTGTQGETKPTESGNTSQGETKPTESENTSQGETKPAEGENTSQEETKPAEGENTSQEETKPTESETISLADTHWSSADTVITDETGLTTVTIKAQMYLEFSSSLFYWYDINKADYQNALNSLPLELNNETPSASKKLSHSLYDIGRYTVEGRTINFSKSSYSNAVELTLSEDLQSFVLTETYNGQSYKITFNRIESSPANAVVTMTLNPKDDTSEIVGCWVLSNTISDEISGLKVSIQKPQYIVCDENAGKIFSFDNVKFMEELTKYKQSQNTEAYSVDIPYDTEEANSISYFKIGSKITIASMDSDGTISYLIGTLSEDKKSITIPLEDEEDGTTEIIYTKVETVPENAKLTIEVLPTSSEPAADTSPSLNISSMNLNLLGKGK